MEHMWITALPHLDSIYGRAYTRIYKNVGVSLLGCPVYTEIDKAESAAYVGIRTLGALSVLC